MNSNYLSSKPRYEILDGLRGIAAIVVVFYHLRSTLLSPTNPKKEKKKPSITSVSLFGLTITD